MIPHWTTFAWNDTYTYAVGMMLASFAMIRINDWYSKKKARRGEFEVGGLEALFAREDYRETRDYRPWTQR
jgi:hypothetical protein